MKNLGKPLSREQQKQIKGGDHAVIWECFDVGDPVDPYYTCSLDNPTSRCGYASCMPTSTSCSDNFGACA